MINCIETIEDVQTFIKQLLDEGLVFHPDTPFEDYIDLNSGTSLFTFKCVGNSYRRVNVKFLNWVQLSI